VKGILRSTFTWRSDTILIAEPDQLLRRMEYRALSPKYRIVQASSIQEAVRTAARHATEIDLLLTEVRLPHGFGWELTELLKLDYPGLKVIYMASSKTPKSEPALVRLYSSCCRARSTPIPSGKLFATRLTPG
jgi:DNA-binding NtrC family response regulator